MEENKMGVMPEGKLLVTMSLPVMVSMLVQALYNIVDGIFVAWISEAAVTAVSLAFPVQLLMISIATGTGVGVNALLSRRLGQKRQQAADAVAMHGILLAVIWWLIFAVLGQLFAVPFIGAFSTDAAMTAMGVSYVRVCTAGSCGVFLLFVAERLMQATGNTLYHMYTQLLGAGLNFILDPILIFGLGGAPRLGVAGAALATVLSQIIAMIFGFVINIRFNHQVNLYLRGFRPQLSIMREIYAIGLPAILTQSLSSVLTVCLNAILLPFGSTAIGFYGIYYKLQNFLYMPIIGMNNALIPMIGYNYGAHHFDRIRRLSRYALELALGIMAAGTVVFLLLPEQLLGLFRVSADLRALGVPAVRILALSFCTAACSLVLSGVLQGLGNGHAALTVALLRQMVLLLPLAALGARLIGLPAVWWSFPLAEGLSLIAAVILWRRTLHRCEQAAGQPPLAQTR